MSLPLSTGRASTRPAHRTLRLQHGLMSGPDVHELQQALNGHLADHAALHAGDDQLELDGVYGPATHAAYLWVGRFVTGLLQRTLDQGATVAAQRLIRDPSRLSDAHRRRARRRRRELLRAPTHGGPAALGWPLAVRGAIIGRPGQGTHSWEVAPNNWQSDNALDIGVPKGTGVFAVSDGRIGNRIGPLDSSNPRFAGIRLYVESAANSWYFAHLSALADGIAAGTHVRRGQLVGYSGVANGSPHLHIACRAGSPTSLLAALR